MRSLRKEQIRRLSQGMPDPSDGNKTLVIRADHIEALLLMMSRRESVAIDLLNDVLIKIYGGDTLGAKRLISDFMESPDKWDDERK